MPLRFHAPGVDGPGETELPPDEGRHLARVLRLRPGDRIHVFDGRGQEWTAEVTNVGRVVRVRALAPALAAREPAIRLTLAHGLLKGAREDDLVRDATMLGIAALRPLWSAHTAVGRSRFRAGPALGRWRRIAVGSCKQSGRAVVPDLFEPVDYRESMAGDRSDLRLLLVEPGLDIEALSVSGLMGAAPPSSVTLFVGPEGGWSSDEVAHAVSHGARPIRIGSRTFRADAVPLVAMTALLLAWGEL